MEFVVSTDREEPTLSPGPSGAWTTEAEGRSSEVTTAGHNDLTPLRKPLGSESPPSAWSPGAPQIFTKHCPCQSRSPQLWSKTLPSVGSGGGEGPAGAGSCPACRGAWLRLQAALTTTSLPQGLWVWQGLHIQVLVNPPTPLHSDTSA